MNRTTVKRGIGAVILALVAAGLLAFLLKDKAAQRQDVVDMALPGSDGSIQSTNDSTRLPQLSTDNSGNGSVIAQAGQDASGEATAALVEGTTDAAGKVIASADAAGGAAVEATDEASQKPIDFNVRAPQKASGEFRELDLVNNGESAAPDKTPVEAAAKTTEDVATTTSMPDQGTVIASTAPRKAAESSASQARLIDEKKATAPSSSRTATVITKKSPETQTTTAAPVTEAKPEVIQEEAPAASNQAQNGYAIQLLATSSLSRANDLKKVMAGEGYPTYITKTQQNGKLLYRVRIGQYKTRAEAATDQTAMQRRYKKNVDVNRSAIVAR